jgi:two-component system phosphate regulon response regulator OmpR
MDNRSHILVVDDDDRIRQLICQYLTSNNFFVSVARDVAEAKILMENYIFELLILDVMMPNVTGIEYAIEIRQNSDIPIIMLTAMDHSSDRIKGLESGADDYLAKPFEPLELLLRVQKLIARSRSRNSEGEKVEFGPWDFNLKNNRLSHYGNFTPLTTGEAKLLSILTSNLGKAISREKLAELCGGINERSVDVQIIRLRNKIEDDPKKPIYLQTIRGEGYVFYN